MTARELDVVTGAFGYSGRYITRRLLAMGRRVRTLTGHPERGAGFIGEVEVRPLDFAHPPALIESLRGACTLYNTYWVRFPRGRVTYDDAVRNTSILIAAARAAGVGRIIHLSITQPDEDSSLGYFRGKAQIERIIRESGLSYTILRPTIIFGVEDVLISNIAWFLRHYPVFAIPGDGNYSLQPVYVVDVAELAVAAGGGTGNKTLDAVGPEVYTFQKLVEFLAAQVGSTARIVHLGRSLTLMLARFLGYAVNDVVLTQEEIAGLMANLLISKSEPTGRTRFSDWARRHAHLLGKQYASELRRHYL